MRASSGANALRRTPAAHRRPSTPPGVRPPTTASRSYHGRSRMAASMRSRTARLLLGSMCGKSVMPPVCDSAQLVGRRLVLPGLFWGEVVRYADEDGAVDVVVLGERRQRLGDGLDVLRAGCRGGRVRKHLDRAPALDVALLRPLDISLLDPAVSERDLRRVLVGPAEEVVRVAVGGDGAGEFRVLNLRGDLRERVGGGERLAGGRAGLPSVVVG